jgi:hypothetical protein
MAKKIMLALVALFVVFYLVSQPREAAGGARTLLDGVEWVLSGLVTFFQNLA